MSRVTSVALELPRREDRRTAAEPMLGARTRRRCSELWGRRQASFADWEQPRERFDRLHAEFRNPLGLV